MSYATGDPKYNDDYPHPRPFNHPFFQVINAGGDTLWLVLVQRLTELVTFKGNLSTKISNSFWFR